VARDPGGGRGGESGSPLEVFERSSFHRQFLEYNRATRGSDDARAVLAAEWRYLGRLLAGRENPVVLDLACGSGSFALAWAERGAAVVGIDFDRDLLTAGRERWREAHPSPGPLIEPVWVAGDAVLLPLPDGAVDVVFCNSLLEHVPDWRRVLFETSRVLRPGGVAVIYTTNRYCPFQQEVNGFPFYPWLPGPVQRRALAWIMEHRRDLVNWTDFPAIHWFTFPGMRQAFRQAGLAPMDRLDVIASHGGGGARGAMATAMTRHPAFKLPYYLYAVSLAMYGVKT
jgi:2-polyprenyl-6-hydroxyphenyl methylase/3-demethylubiquinone-9 3-methyltransferase